MKNKKQISKPFGFSKNLLMVLVAVAFLAAIAGGVFYFKKREAGFVVTTPSGPSPIIPAEIALAKRLIQPEDIILEKTDVSPQIPSYNLPLQVKDIANWPQFTQKIQLGAQALSLLENNGFVSVATPKDIAESEVFLMDSRRSALPKDDFIAFYKEIGDRDLPVFITSDSLLHYYHIFFDTTLMKLERDLFYDDIWQMTKELFDDALLQYDAATGDLKEAAKRNAAYLSVALELLSPEENQVMSEEALKEEYCQGVPSDYCEQYLTGFLNIYGGKASFKYFSEEEAEKYSFEAPDFVKDLVQKEIELIGKHGGWDHSPIFIYKEDYSQYVPRGHYTKSEKLKNYFKTMMWYGRMTNLISGSPQLEKGRSSCLNDGIISDYDANIQNLQSLLIAKKFSESKNIQQKWQRMYAITSFFVGFSDDIGPYEYSTVLNSFFEGEITSQGLKEKYPDIKDTLLSLPFSPKIYSGLGQCELTPPFSSEQAERFLKNTKGFRLMGQRFTIDSYLFSKIVSPYSGIYTGSRTPRPFTWVETQVGREARGFPRGLDVMALFGSERAKEILEDLGDTEYSDYEPKFSELKSEIDSFSTDDWFQNLYWNWLYVLRSLLAEWGEGYPTFMQTEAWQDKELNTALASWAELRHDTILYVKQSYTMAEMGGVIEPKIVGYVEPAPEFYARLLTLTEMTNKGLKGLVPQEELEKLNIEPALDRFSEILTKLLEISEKELENKPLAEEEYDFIDSFGDISEGLIKFVSGGDVDPEIFKTVLVADVHTEGNTLKVLEEGVGFIKTLVVAYKLPEGHILVGVGPVFSYYEFKQPMENRLTDEAWREMLDTQAPLIPEWTKSFSE